MTQYECVMALKANYRLEQSMYDYTIDTLAKSGLNEFSGVLQRITNSKKYDYLAKLHDAVDSIEKTQLQLTDTENYNTNKWCDVLYSKITWYFDELAWLKPTVEQLEKQVWKTHQSHGKDLISEKESKVCDLIGDTKELYRLSTQNKPLLADKIKSVVLDLVKQKKTGTAAIGYESNPVAKLMNKGNGK